MKTNGFKNHPYKTYDAILYVTAYHEGQLEGILTHPRLGTPQKITSLPQMLFLLDELLSREDLLLSHPGADATGKPDLKKLASLRLQILFQEHHTWQGCIHWEEGGKSLTFRSVLELVQILDEILTD